MRQMTTQTFCTKWHIPRESHIAIILTGLVLKGSSKMVLASKVTDKCFPNASLLHCSLAFTYIYRTYKCNTKLPKAVCQLRISIACSFSFVSDFFKISIWFDVSVYTRRAGYILKGILKQIFNIQKCYCGAPFLRCCFHAAYL
jgi:hypothetical protein